ncbi:LexA family transcriptional regulator [Bacillus sp. FJAT-42315]|uniref:LexA family transcriptional regulator n=1 Tax=Bacillus sp. FJAT-42315 TaxID=2014077 RepID=UPI0012FEFF1F|nr:XRE family transcriptional regulator [Bacillus sp. FJAT-42315]
MQRYHEILKKYIRESGLSLDEISKRLEHSGFSTKKAYLSRLQNGKIPPAGDELNRALASILDRDEYELILTSYLEKAPPEFKKLINENENLETSLENTLNTLFQNAPPHLWLSEEDTNALIEEGFNPYDKDTFMKQIKSDLGLLDKWNLYTKTTKYAKVYQEITDDESINLLVDLPNSLESTRNSSKANSKINDFFENIKCKEKKVVNIPYLKNIYASHTYVEEDVLGFETIPKDILPNNKGFILSVPDESMNVDGINIGDKVLINFESEAPSTDIVIIAVEDQPAIISRVHFHDDICIIRPSNPSVPLTVVNSNKVSILGKVIEVWKRIIIR